MKNTTLKDLGLTGGRAIIRFNYRAIDEEKFKKIDEDFQLKLSKKLELEEKSKQKQQEVVVEPEIQKVKIVEPEKPKQPTPIEINNPKKLKPQSIISSQPMEIDESKCSAFSEKPKINNEFANFKVTINPVKKVNFELKLNLSIKFPEDTKGMVLNDLNELAEIEALSKKVNSFQN